VRDVPVTRGGASGSEPASRRHRATTAALLVAAAVVFVGTRAAYLDVPLERDEGEYAYVAQRMLLGEVPYRDVFDQKPPGVFVAYLLAFAVFGPSVEGIHLLAGLWTLATGVALFATVRRIAGELEAGFALVVFAPMSVDPRLLATAANTEIFMLLPMVASTWCVARGVTRGDPDPGGSGWWLAAGALGGVACAFKQVAVTSLLFAAGAALLGGTAGRDVRWRRLGALAAGALLVWLPIVGAFVVLGAFAPFLDAVLLHNLRYSSSAGWNEGAVRLLLAVAHQAPGLAVVWLLAASALIVPRVAPPRVRAFLGAWWAASFAGVAIGLYFRPHYFVQLLPALASLCGVTLGAALRPWLSRPGPLAALGMPAAGVLAALGPQLLGQSATLRAPNPTALSRAIYGMNPFPEAQEIAAYIRNTSGPDDAVFVLGSEPEILFHAERRSATRYIFAYPLTGDFPDILERQREVVRALQRERPLYIVWVQLQASLLIGLDSERYLFEEVASIVRTGYRIELLARPGAEDGPFDFHHGAEARELFRELTQAAGSPAWVAVFRRAP
jgi:4-amino-4-deoxy-L-arabinose transferase-like glycosyltransferase